MCSFCLTLQIRSSQFLCILYDLVNPVTAYACHKCVVISISCCTQSACHAEGYCHQDNLGFSEHHSAFDCLLLLIGMHMCMDIVLCFQLKMLP